VDYGEDLVLTKATDTPGFYLQWTPYGAKKFSKFPHCCIPGYRTTKFIYENNKYIPVSETETMFAKVFDKVKGNKE
jgi:hypothetical protein